jgi:hypothetical protein
MGARDDSRAQRVPVHALAREEPASRTLGYVDGPDPMS